jgi:hypothetical protein
MSLFEIVGSHGLGLSFEERFLPVAHHLLHSDDVVLHLLDELVNFVDDSHSLSDERVDALRVPGELLDTINKGSIH